MLSLQFCLGHFFCACPTRENHNRIIKVIVNKNRGNYATQQLKHHLIKHHFYDGYEKGVIKTKKPAITPAIPKVDKDQFLRSLTIMMADLNMSDGSIEAASLINAFGQCFNLASTNPGTLWNDVLDDGDKLISRKRLGSMCDEIANELDQTLV